MHATLDTQVLKRRWNWLAGLHPCTTASPGGGWPRATSCICSSIVTARCRAPTDSGRDAIISCGAVLDHLRVAMLAAGWDAVIERFPNPNDPDHLASIEFSSVDHVTDAQRDRAAAILQRRTDRLPLGRPTYWDFFEPVLRSTIDDSLVKLRCALR